MADAVPHPQALATVTQGSAEQHHTFVVALDKEKLKGKNVGIDVTYSSAATWTRNGVFVARVHDDGLVAEWNAAHREEKKLMPSDFIFQVNQVHGDTVSMVQEMKVKQGLTLHILRRSTVPPPPPAAEGCWVAKNPAAQAPTKPKTEVKVDSLLKDLRELDDKDLAGLAVVVLEQRKDVREQVLGDGEDVSAPLTAPTAPATPAPPTAATAAEPNSAAAEPKAAAVAAVEPNSVAAAAAAAVEPKAAAAEPKAASEPQAAEPKAAAAADAAAAQPTNSGSSPQAAAESGEKAATKEDPAASPGGSAASGVAAPNGTSEPTEPAESPAVPEEKKDKQEEAS